VATSLRPDRGHTWVGPRFGWLPGVLATTPWLYEVRPNGATWQEDFVLNYVRGAQSGQLSVSIGPDAFPGSLDLSRFEPVRVHGVDGWRPAEPGMAQLYLTLADGVQVMLNFGGVSAYEPPSGPPYNRPSQDPDQMTDLLRVAEELDFGPWPDMSWVGSR
jgi:hypothetical protein